MTALMAVTVVAYGLIAVSGWHRRPVGAWRRWGGARRRHGGARWRPGQGLGVRWPGGVPGGGAAGPAYPMPAVSVNGRSLPVSGWSLPVQRVSVRVPAWFPPVALGLVGAAVWFPWGLFGAGAWPAFRRVRLAGLRRRSDAVWAEGIDVLVVLVGLGLGGGASLRRAMAEALPWVGGDVGRELGSVLARVDRGASLADELEAMVAAARPQLSGLARVVAATERYGAPAVSELEALALERRLDERQRLERMARRVPVQLLVPLVCGVLPAFVLLSVVPMLAGALGNLRGLAP